MTRIFISYRRQDTERDVVHIYDRLKDEFGSSNVVLDTKTFKPAEDFRQEINKSLESCDVMLVIIGDKWLDILSKRTDDSDWVQYEIEKGLQEKHIKVVPVLLYHDNMPPEDKLPDPIRDLAYIGAIPISLRTFDTDLKELIKTISTVKKNDSRVWVLLLIVILVLLLGVGFSFSGTLQLPNEELTETLSPSDTALLTEKPQTPTLENIASPSPVVELKRITPENIDDIEIFDTIQTNDNLIYRLQFHPSDNLLGTASRDDTVTLFDASLLSVQNRLASHHLDVLSLDFNVTGDLVASGSSDGAIKVWDVETGSNIETFTPNPLFRWDIDFAPDSNFIAAVGQEGHAFIWNRSESSIPITFPHDGESSYYSVDFKPDGNHLAAANSNNTVFVWQVNNYRDFFTLAQLNGAGGGILDVTYSDEGEFLAFGGYDNRIWLWNTDNYTRTGSLIGHTDAVRDIDFFSDNQLLASVGWDKTVRIWNARQGTLLKTLEFDTKLYSVSINSDDTLIAIGDENGNVYLIGVE